MEKGTPHTKLDRVKTLVRDGKIRATFSSISDAAKLGMSVADMGAVIEALTIQDFYKSMTTHADHRIWQDVYRPHTAAGPVYLKLTVVKDVLIVSFKEL
ncbi:mRNA interferase MqsR [Pollutimonas subterranea]|uniref:mRNA interferase MqsR n=1 Tax=Pollutimonas subterranea TaxID=2045210 RepID=A0A2N4U1C1_9BURK|nr:type II toxin-antitoxin system MqsR family toxin [Pollutimonas subterranea]PLC48800.1 mRNA interferase MqsR [Pollutimonas subterranea]